MPLYAMECTNCKKEYELFAKVDERNRQRCKICSGPLRVVIMPGVYTYKPIDPYYDAGLGCVVKSRQERQKKMKELGLVEAGDIPPWKAESLVDKPKEKLSTSDEWMRNYAQNK
jgi:putative FmdB family regulatory protein